MQRTLICEVSITIGGKGLCLYEGLSVKSMKVVRFNFGGVVKLRCYSCGQQEPQA